MKTSTALAITGGILGLGAIAIAVVAARSGPSGDSPPDPTAGSGPPAPDDGYTLEPIDGTGHVMRSDAARAFNAMYAAAVQAGHPFTVASSFRSWLAQEELRLRYLTNPCAGTPLNPTGISLPGCGNLASPPGNSKHERGLSVDINIGHEGSPVWLWLTANGSRFNFYNTGLTFQQREAWHWDHIS